MITTSLSLHQTCKSAAKHSSSHGERASFQEITSKISCKDLISSNIWPSILRCLSELLRAAITLVVCLCHSQLPIFDILPAGKLQTIKDCQSLMVTSPRATHFHSMFPLSPSLMTNCLRLVREKACWS